MYSLIVKSDSNGTRNLATLYVGVPIDDNMGLKGVTLLTKDLCTLAKPYNTPGVQPWTKIMIKTTNFTGKYLKGRNFLRKKFLRKKFLRFITSKMLYYAEEIFAVEGFLINFAELFFCDSRE